MRLPLLSPTLLALVAVGAWGQLSAADQSGERDALFDAVRALIDHEVQGPAARQLKTFTAASFPDATWYQKFLDWDYADRFHTTDPAQTEAMNKELAQAAAAGQLPPAVRDAFKESGDTMWRMVKDLANDINPDAPPQGVGADFLSAAQKSARQRLVVGIIASCKQDWDQAVQALKDFAPSEKRLWDMDEKNPEYKTLSYQACKLRYDACHVLWKAHLVLREVITRGKEFGVDATPVNEFYQEIFKNVKDDDGILNWDYQYGDQYPPLKADANTLLAEAVRQKIPGVSGEDVETELFKIIDLDLKPYPQAVRDEFVELQLNTWTELLRWHLELGDDRSLRRGIEDLQMLQDRLKNMNVQLNSATPRAVSLAKALIVGGRLQAAAHNVSAANQLLAEVAGSKANPLAPNAAQWIGYLAHGSGVHAGDNAWGSAPEADEPQLALSTAESFIQQAKDTDDFKLSQSMWVNAAVALRNGILGLSDGYEDEFIANAPALYERYAFVLYKMNMHYHAAIAAEQGLKAVAARITPKQNPWRVGGDPKRPLTEDGKAVEKLVKNGKIYARSLVRLAGATTKGVQAVNERILTLAFALLPELQGRDAEKDEIVAYLTEGNFDEAIAKAREFAHKYSDDADYYWAFSVITNALMSKYDALSKAGRTDDLPDVANQLQVLSKKIQDRLKDKPSLTSDERKALTTAISAPVFVNFTTGKYADVIQALSAEFWRSAPPDDGLRARMLRYLCMSELKGQETTPPTDPAAVTAAFTTLQPAYTIFSKQAPRIRDEDALHSVMVGAKALASAYNKLQSTAARLVNANVAGADKLLPLIKSSRTILADLLYPTITAKTPPGNIYAVAGLLWEMDGPQAHEKAGHCYQLYLQAIGNDIAVQDFKRNPKPVLDAVENAVTQRPELRDDWKAIRANLEDGPGVEDWRTGKASRDEISGQPVVDYVQALEKLRPFRRRFEDLRTLMGDDQYTACTKQLDALLATVLSCGQEIQAKKRLAQYDREAGKGDEARLLYNELIHYDPDDPDFALAFVDNVLDDLPKSTVQPAQIEKARGIAAKIRDSGDQDLQKFWTAQIQVFELSIALKDMGEVNDALASLAARGDVSSDLVQPAVRGDAKIRGDDRHIRRPANEGALTLARRYLRLYQAPGVTAKPSFEIRDVEVDGKTYTLFVDVGTPQVVGYSVENADGDPVVEFLPAGVSPNAPPPPPTAPSSGSTVAPGGAPSNGSAVAPTPKAGAHP